MLESFCKRWQQEYLTQLCEYHHSHKRKSQTMKKGYIVLIQDNVKHLNRTIGQIEELLKGRDGNT